MSRLRVISVLLLSTFLGFAACSDDSSDPAGPGADETAPVVFSTEPGPDDANVPASEDVVIQFNEAMDTGSATGNVTLSAGSITDLSWDDDQTLRIEHSAWAAGVRVEVTLGTGIADAAGNGLEVPYTWGFWVETPDVVLIDTDPADGATDVSLNTRVNLRFNRQMNLATLAAATSVDDGIAGRAAVGFSYSEGPEDRVLMTFDEDLPSLATITVTIGTGATSAGGQPLAAETSFSFTTGSESDTTPPTLISVVPANGSEIPPSTSEIVFTFSEAIDELQFEPSMIGGQFMLLLERAGIQPGFSGDGTVLTVPLPVPLPAGLPIYAMFEEFLDLAGNASTSPLEYRVDVAGAADPWPFEEGWLQVWYGEETVTEGLDPPVTNDYLFLKDIEKQPGGSIHRNAYFDVPATVPENWDIFERDGSVIDYLGFGELDEGVPVEANFADPVPWLPLPPTVGTTWDGSTTFPFESVTGDLEYSGEIVAVEDLPLDFDPESMGLTWIDCWKVHIQYEISSEGSTLLSGEQYLWYAPTVGPVREMSHEAETTADRVSDQEQWLLPTDPEEL